MKAKKMLAVGLEWIVIGAVMIFLALHSINLFTFVFPPDQQYLAYLGFGLTGLGAIAYLLMFLSKAKTILQRVVTLVMTVICAIGEVLAAIFGMQIEAWKKNGFTMTEQDFQTMLLVIGILSIAHFVAIILYYAGDKIAELMRDDDGDGIPNIVDADYQPRQQPQPQPVRRPVPQPTNGQHPVWELDQFLKELKITHQQAEAIIHNNAVQNPDQFYSWLKAYGVEQINISRKNFNRLYGQLRSKVNP